MAAIVLKTEIPVELDHIVDREGVAIALRERLDLDDGLDRGGHQALPSVMDAPTGAEARSRTSSASSSGPSPSLRASARSGST